MIVARRLRSNVIIRLQMLTGRPNGTSHSSDRRGGGGLDLMLGDHQCRLPVTAATGLGVDRFSPSQPARHLR